MGDSSKLGVKERTYIPSSERRNPLLNDVTSRENSIFQGKKTGKSLKKLGGFELGYSEFLLSVEH